MPRSRTLAIIVGGVAALAITGAAMAHPGLGLVDRVDVLARALGISADEVEQAKDDGTLRDLMGDLTLDDLSEAFGAETDAAIDEALADGSITPAQAERLSGFSEGQPFGRFSGGFRGFGGFEDFDREAFSELCSAAMAIEVDRVTVYADVLGIPVAEVEAAIEGGSLRELLSKVDSVVLGAALIDARDAAIDAALAAGDITAEQAELLRETSFGGFGHGSRFRGGFGGFGGRGGFGGFGHGFHGGEAPANSNTSISI